MLNQNETAIALDLSEAVIAEDPTSSTSLRHQAFLGWATNGDITGNLLYVNYARRSDFRTLQTLGINLTGSIGIARYGGGMFRGVKADQADQFGLLGLILYSDPNDDGFARGPVFPDGPWLPSTGYQRGSVRFTFKCPGNMNAARMRERCDYALRQAQPNIPLLPMSYGNAQLLMQNMTGFATNGNYNDVGVNLSDWQGGMHFVYKTGVNHVNSSNATKVRLVVDNLEEEAVLSQVFGFIPGYKYQNETVLIGAHRDAWVFGAADPISGTTSVLEVARAFGEIIQEHGYRPKRNIMFASWDAEEQSLIGSTTFVETEEDLVRSTIIAYFNEDVAVSGDEFGILSDPLLETLFIEQMKNVPQPYSDNDEDTLYSVWKQQNFPNSDDDQVYTGILGSGSDFVPFYHHVGITTAYSRGFRGAYGTYHSVYDSYVYMQIVDPSWERARAQAQLHALVIFEMVDNDVIPFDITNMHPSMRRWIGDLQNLADAYECDIDSIAPNVLQPLSAAVDSFGNVAVEIDSLITALDSDETGYEEEVVKFNGMLKLLTRQFLIDEGLPDRKYYKNILVAPDILGGYGAYSWPYIAYAIQYNCTAQYLNETVSKTVDVIESATDFVASYL